jgi:hypothetical protein
MLRKNNLKTFFFSTTALALISMITPEIAQAARYQSSIMPTDRYLADYLIATGRKDSDPNPNKGRFVEAIQQFKIFDQFPEPDIIVPRSPRRFLTLETMPVSNCDIFTNSNFSNISGPIYEYRFFVTNFQNIPLDPNFKPFPYDNAGFVKWCVPSNFTYTVAEKSFSIAFGNGNSADLTQNLVNSLKGLQTIFQRAQEAGLPSVEFPSDIDGTPTVVTIQTTPIPEPNTSASLIVLGLAGSLILYKRKIS